MKWKPLKYLNLGLSYQYFNVDVDVEDTRLHWAIDYQYDGPMLTIGTQF